MGKNLFFKKVSFVRKLVLLLLLSLFWVLLSGMYDLFHFSLGIISIILVMMLNSRILGVQFYSHEKLGSSLRFHRLFLYIPWLIWQIIVSSIQVAVIILSPKMPINPSLVRFKVKLPSTAAKVVLGNSITLTPGTLTIDIDGDEFLVHAIADSSFGLIESGKLSDSVGALFMPEGKDTLEYFQIIRTVEDL
jgi:multicomponent Na+:H+ antiporter subunit E